MLAGMACAALRPAAIRGKGVVAVVQRLFDAMASRDSAAAHSVLIAEAGTFGEGRRRSVALAERRTGVRGAAGQRKEEMRERMWNPRS